MHMCVYKKMKYNFLNIFTPVSKCSMHDQKPPIPRDQNKLYRSPDNI